MNDFERSLKDWIGQPRLVHAWVNFKTYFETAHKVLQEMRGPTLKNTIFTNTASSIINSVRSELSEDRDKVFQRIDATESSILNALTSSSGSSNDKCSISGRQSEASSFSDLTERVNTTTSDKVQLEILKLLQQIQTDMKTYQPVNDKDTSKGGKPGKRKRQQRKRIDTSKYCWSCGAWNHKSIQCKQKKLVIKTKLH